MVKFFIRMKVVSWLLRREVTCFWSLLTRKTGLISNPTRRKTVRRCSTVPRRLPRGSTPLWMRWCPRVVGKNEEIVCWGKIAKAAQHQSVESVNIVLTCQGGVDQASRSRGAFSESAGWIAHLAQRWVWKHEGEYFCSGGASSIFILVLYFVMSIFRYLAFSPMKCKREVVDARLLGYQTRLENKPSAIEN